MTDNFFLKLSKFFLYLVPFTVIIVTRGTFFPFIVGKYVFFRSVVELALICFIWAWARGEFKKPNFDFKFTILKNPLVIATAIFTFIFLLSGFLGYNPSASFWSNFERGEGGLQMLHLFIFFVLLVLLFRDENSWRWMLRNFLLGAVLLIAYGLAAAAGNRYFIGADLCARFTGSLGNAAYVGTYMIFSLFFGLFLLNDWQDKRPKWLNWLLGILVALFFVFLIFSQTRGAFLGLAVSLAAGLIYSFFRLPKGGRGRKLAAIAGLILVILSWLGYLFHNSIDLMPFCLKTGGGNRILDITVNAETFQTRLLLWKQAVRIAAQRPLLGWGPENFSVPFEKLYLPRFEVWYDRAHNVFFDYLAETGILGLLSYLGIFGAFYWQFFRRKSLVISRQSLVGNALLFALPVAYLVQGMALFEVLSIYIGLFFFLAFAVYKFGKSQNTNDK